MNRMWCDGRPIDNLSRQTVIRKCGHLKKLKTMKRKYFVLWSGSTTQHARLDYFDSEKKFRTNNFNPKRSIDLYTCFSINRKCDTKQKNAFVVYTIDDSLAMVADSDDDQERWLEIMQEVHEEGFDVEGAPRPVYEHVWEASMQNKGLGQLKGLIGPYRVCLSDNSVSLVKVGAEIPEVTFQLAGIRRCGHVGCQFFMEVGRYTSTGEGEMWMHVDDGMISQSMHEVILNAMKSPGPTQKRAESSSRSVPSCSTSTTDVTISRGNSFGQSTSYRKPHPLSSDKPRPHTMYNSLTNVMPLSSSVVSLKEPASSKEVSSVRTRTNSVDSRASSGSGAGSLHDNSGTAVDGMSGCEETSAYFSMTPTSRSSSVTSRTGTRDRYDSCGSGKEEQKISDGYFDMSPSGDSLSCTTPVKSLRGSVDIEDAYIDMSPTQAPATPPGNADLSGYLAMAPVAKQHILSTPIVSKPTEEGYFDMAINQDHQDHLPTVSEQISPGYITMRAKGLNMSMGCDLTELKPDRVVSYLSDDSISGDIAPKRTYSVGSRPLNKSMKRYHSHAETNNRKMLEGNMSTSAPHLKIKAPFITSGASPTTLGSSFKSDDLDSFMEIEFYRSRTASDSHGSRSRTVSESLVSRPRTSSFTQNIGQSRYAHRPRSSSHGQSSQILLKKPLYHHSVRTTSSELLKQVSQESLLRSSRESLISSTDSLRKYAIEERARKSALSTSEYSDMKASGSSPGVSKKDINMHKLTSKPDYFDMTCQKSGESSPDNKHGPNSSPVLSRHVKDGNAYVDYDPAEGVNHLSSGQICHSYVNLDYEVPLIPSIEQPKLPYKPEKTQNIICDSSTNFTPLMHSSSEILICCLEGDENDVNIAPPPMPSQLNHSYVNVSPRVVRAATSNEVTSDPYVAYDPVEFDEITENKNRSSPNCKKGGAIMRPGSLDTQHMSYLLDYVGHKSGKDVSDYMSMAPGMRTERRSSDSGIPNKSYSDTHCKKINKPKDYSKYNSLSASSSSLAGRSLDICDNASCGNCASHKHDNMHKAAHTFKGGEQKLDGQIRGKMSLDDACHTPVVCSSFDTKLNSGGMPFRDGGLFCIKKCPLRKISEAVEPPLDNVQTPGFIPMRKLTNEAPIDEVTETNEPNVFMSAEKVEAVERNDVPRLLNVKDNTLDNNSLNGGIKSCVTGDDILEKCDNNMTVTDVHESNRKVDYMNLCISSSTTNADAESRIESGNSSSFNITSKNSMISESHQLQSVNTQNASGDGFKLLKVAQVDTLLHDTIEDSSNDYVSLTVSETKINDSKVKVSETKINDSDLKVYGTEINDSKPDGDVCLSSICTDKLNNLGHTDLLRLDEDCSVFSCDKVASLIVNDANLVCDKVSSLIIQDDNSNLNVLDKPEICNLTVCDETSQSDSLADALPTSMAPYMEMCTQEPPSPFNCTETPNSDLSDTVASSGIEEPQKSLNYISLDISALDASGSHTQGRGKSRQASGSGSDLTNLMKCQYATIDFKKSEEMANASKQSMK